MVRGDSYETLGLSVTKEPALPASGRSEPQARSLGNLLASLRIHIGRPKMSDLYIRS